MWTDHKINIFFHFQRKKNTPRLFKKVYRRFILTMIFSRLPMLLDDIYYIQKGLVLLSANKTVSNKKWARTTPAYDFIFFFFFLNYRRQIWCNNSIGWEREKKRKKSKVCNFFFELYCKKTGTWMVRDGNYKQELSQS